MAAKVKNVIPNSPSACCGVRSGDILISINGRKITDVLDYMYFSAEREVKLVLKRDKKFLVLKLIKNEYDDLGLEFETFLIDKKQHCSNKCVFCFIDQMPPGMRDTLYFKDDDARLSFLQGNYVTLTNLGQGDIDRIIEMRLNINVSVHTTNPELRCKMMNNRFAGEKIGFLKQMADAGLSMNCQIVLCPELNDGNELIRTISDLGDLMPNISSIAVVPVGITKFRDKLYPLKTFDKEGALRTIEIIEGFQQKFLEKYKTRLVFPSDEFYLTAGLPLPEAECYEEYPQYENGVGMLRSTYDEFYAALNDTDVSFLERKVSIATGAAAYDMICELARSAEEKYHGLECRVYKIINHFFGETITVAGLLTAQDITQQLKDKPLGDELLLSESMIMRNNDLFLDDHHISDVEKELNVKIRLSDNNGRSLLNAILGLED